MATLAGAALWYAARGHLVFPLRPGTKVPATAHGFRDASTNPDTIRAWWARHPAANIGLATGHLFDVIDVDGPTGMASLAGLTPEQLREPIGIVRTPGDQRINRPQGWHYLIPPTGDGCATAVMPGIDYRGNGGYVVAPPSVIDGKAYEWTDPLQLPEAS